MHTMNNTTENHDEINAGMLRIDLQASMHQSTLDPRELSSFQRILLTTDGTITEILEAQIWESIQVVKLYQDIVELDIAVPYLNVESGTQALIRKVMLRGKLSHKNYVYAESIIIPERLDDKLKDGLLKFQKTIGLLILEDRLETFREILSCKMEPAEEVAKHFDIEPDSNLISRTYRIFANRLPIMLITEKFPETSFKN